MISSTVDGTVFPSSSNTTTNSVVFPTTLDVYADKDTTSSRQRSSSKHNVSRMKFEYLYVVVFYRWIEMANLCIILFQGQADTVKAHPLGDSEPSLTSLLNDIMPGKGDALSTFRFSHS